MIAVIFLPLLFWRRLRDPDLHPQREIDPSGPAFDRCYGVDTSGVIPIAHLDVSDPSWIHGFGYQGVVPDELETLWSDLEIDYPNTVFIDLGAGKGRAMMLAAKMPFKRVIGIEIARELCIVAKANFQIFNAHGDCRARSEVCCADASSYEFPHAPLVVFLYNPFGTPTMQRVIGNLVASLQAVPRRATVIYVRPELAELWDHVAGFSLVATGARLRIYDYRPTRARDVPPPS